MSRALTVREAQAMFNAVDEVRAQREWRERTEAMAHDDHEAAALWERLSFGYDDDLLRVLRTPGERVPEITARAFVRLGLARADSKRLRFQRRWWRRCWLTDDLGRRVAAHGERQRKAGAR